MKRSAYILNGPNLNLLGTREPHIYGSTTLAQVQKQCEEHAAQKAISISFFQSNHEGVLIDLIQEARTKADAIIFNPAGYSFHYLAVLEGLKTVEGPIIQGHNSNIHRRDEHQRHSMISNAANGVICGLGPQGYIAAIDAVAAMPADSFAKVKR